MGVSRPREWRGRVVRFSSNDRSSHRPVAFKSTPGRRFPTSPQSILHRPDAYVRPYSQFLHRDSLHFANRDHRVRQMRKCAPSVRRPKEYMPACLPACLPVRLPIIFVVAVDRRAAVLTSSINADLKFVRA